MKLTNRNAGWLLDKDSEIVKVVEVFRLHCIYF